MFLHLLTAEEQSVFCQLAFVVMAADGVTHEKERAFLRRVRGDLDLAELPPSPGGEVIVPDGLFTSVGSRRALLVELAGLAAADGEVSGDERVLIDAVARRFEVPEEAVQQIVAYAERLVAVLDEGVVLVAGGG